MVTHIADADASADASADAERSPASRNGEARREAPPSPKGAAGRTTRWGWVGGVTKPLTQTQSADPRARRAKPGANAPPSTSEAECAEARCALA